MNLSKREYCNNLKINDFNDSIYNGFESSKEILYAIEKITGDSILDMNSAAYSEFINGYNSEKIIKLAISLVVDETDCLHWGCSTIKID